MLGKSLEDLLNICGHKFSLKTVLMIADQLIDRICFVHSRSYIHRDIKPDNFLTGDLKGPNSSTIYIIDFGLAKKYMQRNGEHIEYREGKSLTGTARYASINTQMGIEQGRRDDMESLGYVLIYFLKGVLPWQNLQANDKNEKYEKIQHKKLSTSIQELCFGLPPEFCEYMTYVRNMTFTQEPDYNHLKNLFKRLL